jgi:glycosyltransferase involved in cell wall biosynthesis
MKYVLTTAARNEEAFHKDADLVVQTLLPARWVIVDDRSMDRTVEIVESHAKRHPWIERIRRVEDPDRKFASKAQAVNAGLERVQSLEFEVVGNLDADVSFDDDYFEFLMSKFAEDSSLGVAGTAFSEDSRQYDYRFTNIEHVSGACQMFRRECFAEIGGYVPIPGGGIDWVAVTTARMKGWKVRSFPEKRFYHHRMMGTAMGPLRALFPMEKRLSRWFPTLAIVPRGLPMTKTPVFTGGISLLCGYCYSYSADEARGDPGVDALPSTRTDEKVGR